MSFLRKPSISLRRLGCLRYYSRMTIDIRPLDPDMLEPAFELATHIFIEGSTLHRALGIGLTEYRSYLCSDFRAMVCEGLSVCAIDTTSDELLGCLIVTDVAAQLGARPHIGSAFAPLAALNDELFGQYLKNREISAGDTVLVDMGAVSQSARGQGVYQRLRSAAHDLACKRGFRRVLGELSSAATQHFVLNRLGHEKVAEVAFAGFEFEGTRPFSSIEDPESLILAEGML